MRNWIPAQGRYDKWSGKREVGVWGGTGYRLKAGMTNGAVSGKWGRDAACVMRVRGA